MHAAIDDDTTKGRAGADTCEENAILMGPPKIGYVMGGSAFGWRIVIEANEVMRMHT